METSTATAISGSVCSADASLQDAVFDLDVTIVSSGLAAAGFSSEDCTGDGCGGTDASACVTC